MSLSRMMRELQNEKKEPASQPKQTISSVYETITEEQVLRLWREYARSIATTDAMMFSIMNITPVLEGTTIKVNVPNAMCVSYMEENANLLRYLRTQLRNSNVMIKAIVDAKQQGSNVVYTRQQKLDKMIEKNPMVKVLIDKYKLEFDF